MIYSFNEWSLLEQFEHLNNREKANAIIAELNKRDLGHTILSNETQLNNGNVFFEFLGQNAKKLALKAFALYKLDPTLLIEPVDEFLKTFSTGTPYYISAKGFLKHNTGSQKVEYFNYIWAVDWCINNAMRLCTESALNIYTKLTVVPKSHREYPINSIKEKTKDILLIESMEKIYEQFPDLYKTIAPSILSFLDACDILQVTSQPIHIRSTQYLTNMNNLVLSAKFDTFYFTLNNTIHTSISPTKLTFSKKANSIFQSNNPLIEQIFKLYLNGQNEEADDIGQMVYLGLLK